MSIVSLTHSFTTSMLSFTISPGTSIGLVPSGRIAVAGFTDGTLRLFDLTGIFAKDKNHPDNNRHYGKKEDHEGLFDDDASSSSENSFHSSGSNAANNASTGGKGNTSIVNSQLNQRYGAVACQIHARGVHTSLLMDVAVSEDGLYAFGGVQRGSVELAAVYLGDVEGYLDTKLDETKNVNDGKQLASNETPGLLDLIQVDRHADAKLKGFGACARLWNGWERARNGVERPEYLLFTGKGIKVRESVHCMQRFHMRHVIVEEPLTSSFLRLCHRTSTFGVTVLLACQRMRSPYGRASMTRKLMAHQSLNSTSVITHTELCRVSVRATIRS